MPKSWLTCALLVLGSFVFTRGLLAQTRYSLTDLGTLAGGSSGAYGINNAGVIVGWSRAENVQNPHGFIFDGGMRELPTVMYAGSEFTGINSAGHMSARVGFDGFLFDGGWHTVGRLEGTTTATSLNDLDVVVGYSATDPDNQHAFYFDGVIHDIGTLGGSSSEASAINNAGIIVGSSGTDPGNKYARRAFVYDGTMHGFGPLGSSANGINNSGKVVGNFGVYDIATGTLRNIQPLNAYRSSWSTALDINDGGDIVGTYSPDGQVVNTVGFIYDRAGRFRDLNTLVDGSDGWVIQEARSINESGQIVGWARKPPSNNPFIGPEHAVLLNPLTRPRYSFDLATPAGTTSNVLRLDGANKIDVWFSITNANRPGAPGPHDGIYDTGLINHPNSGIGLRQMTDADGQKYLLLSLTKMGDVNLDGQLTLADCMDLVAHFNSRGTWQEGDLNYDGAVTIADFNALASGFGSSYVGGPADCSKLGSAAGTNGVPEPPAASVVLAVASACLLQRRQRHKTARLLILIGVLGLLNRPVWSDTRYTMIDLGTLGGNSSVSDEINNSGVVIGSSNTTELPYGYRGFVFDGVMRDLPTARNLLGNITGINSVGHISVDVGTADPTYDTDTFVLDRDWQRVVYVGRNLTSVAVNDHDAVTGYSYSYSVNRDRAFYFDGTRHEIGTLGGDGSWATAMNNSGIVVGYSQAEVDSSGYQMVKAFFYDGAIHPIGRNASWAYGINDHGQVVGSSGGQAFVYDLGTGKFENILPMVRDEFRPSSGNDINEAGDIVGGMNNNNPVDMSGFIFDRKGRFADLNTLIDNRDGWNLCEATGINDSGQIAGWGTKNTVILNTKPVPNCIDERHALLLNPIRRPDHIFDLDTPPEPGSISTRRIYGGDKEEYWFCIMNTNKTGAADPHDGIYDSGLIEHPGSGIGLGEFTDAAGQSYLLIRLTRIGDVNLDGQVTIADFMDLAAHFNQSGSWQEGDLNYDGFITIADFIALASNFGTSYSGETVAIGDGDVALLSGFGAAHGVPEPGMMVVLLVGLAMGRGRRLR